MLLVNCLVDSAVRPWNSQTPDQQCRIDMLLHDAPDFIVHWICVRTIWWTQLWGNMKCGVVYIWCCIVCRKNRCLVLQGTVWIQKIETWCAAYVCLLPITWGMFLRRIGKIGWRFFRVTVNITYGAEHFSVTTKTSVSHFITTRWTIGIHSIRITVIYCLSVTVNLLSNNTRTRIKMHQTCVLCGNCLNLIVICRILQC